MIIPSLGQREANRMLAENVGPHLPDREDDERKRNRRRVVTTDEYENAKLLIPMDAQKDDDIPSVMDHAAETFGQISSYPAADRDDLSRDTVHKGAMVSNWHG